MGSSDITKEYDPTETILTELRELRGVVNGLGNDLGSIKTRLSGVEAKLDDLGIRVAVLESRQTRPIWVDEVNKRIGDLGADVNKRIDELGTALRAEVEKGFRLVARRLEKLAGDLNETQGYQREFEDRITRLEQKPV